MIKVKVKKKLVKRMNEQRKKETQNKNGKIMKIFFKKTKKMHEHLNSFVNGKKSRMRFWIDVKNIQTI